MNRYLLAAGAASVLLLATACGQQTDERVATPEATAAASAPAASAEPSGAVASVQAATPYVTVDCVSGQVMPTDTLPNGTTIGSVTALVQPNGAPAITVATDAQPATELGVADMTEGSGAEVKAGDTLTVDYCGVGLGGKALFDSSYSRGTPATFPLDGVIAGWQQGLIGMKVGGTRLLVIPGDLAYGSTPPDGAGIEPDETLIFTVNLQSIS
jgi:hypothetical protein